MSLQVTEDLIARQGKEKGERKGDITDIDGAAVGQ
jgi:hypothetical protein